MSRIGSLSNSANIVIAGASGGIGEALVTALADDSRTGRITALSRRPVDARQACVNAIAVDITDEVSVSVAAEESRSHGPIDLVIVATGMLHKGPGLMPEKRLKDIDATTMTEVLRVNTIGPALLAKHLLPGLRRDAKAVFAAISARVGSIGDNHLGGWASYRASKAALNMLIRTFAIEQSRTHPDAVVATLHPGTVDTNLSRPFQRNVPEGKLFTTDFVAERLLSVLDGLTSTSTGGFFAWDGKRIEY